MSNSPKKIQIKKQNKRRPQTPEMKLSPQERIQYLASLMIDRIIEEEQKYKEKLKTNPNAKRIYESCPCDK